MSDEKKVSIYNPFVDAFCEVPLSQAEKFLENVEEIEKRVAEAKVEVAKDEAYANSLKEKK
jgi:hypothetical protein